jgi:hypothetical protein
MSFVRATIGSRTASLGETIYLLEAWRKQQRRAPERAVNRARRLLLELRRAGAS